MSFVRRLREWTLTLFAAAVLAVSLITTALAQVSGGDADVGDGDELLALAVVLAIAAIAVVGWMASRRRSTRQH